MFRQFLYAVSVAALLLACNNNKSGGNQVNPQLNVKTMNGQCLDLQSAVQQMDTPGFSFPAFIYTRNFQLLSNQGSTYANSLIAKSFRNERGQFKGLQDFRGLKQQGCESVSVPDFGDKTVTYKITGSSPNHLELEFDQNSLATQLEQASVQHQKALPKVPAVKKYVVTVKSPTEIELVNQYQTVPSDCYKTQGMNVREELVYTWGGSPPPAKAQVNAKYWAKLNELSSTPAPVPAPNPPPEQPPVTETPPIPEPPVPTPISAQSVDGDLVTVDLTSGNPTLNALQTYAHPHCM